MDAKADGIGGYRLLEEIGRGGFGVVHRARAPDGGLAAVKLLHSDAGADPQLRATFAREVEAARRVKAFCVARVLDADPHAERPWIASEFIDGPTLTRRLREEGPRRDADLYRLAVSTATALTAIHQAGVAHRDFKPDNIMMAPDGPRVIDFGIARSFENTAFQATAKVGTLHYMAPERLNDSPYLTPAVDVFSWGAVMVYAASTRHTFGGRTRAAVITSILTGEPDCSAVPGELRGLVTRCLDKDPGRRPSAHEVLNALLGIGGDDTDIETSLVSGRSAATEVSPTEEITGTATLRETLKVTEEVPTAGARSAQPYGFAGGWYRSPGEVGEAFQANAQAACEVFGDPDELAALAAWIVERPGGTRISPDLLRQRPADVELAVLRFVAQARPDLTPLFRDKDVGLAGARVLARRRENPLADDLYVPMSAAEVAAEYDCREPGHPCPPGQGCQEYRRVLKAARSAMTHYLRESEHYAAVLAGAEPRARTAFDRRADGDRFLQAVLAPEEWRRAVRKEREGLAPELRRYLPPEPPVGTPQWVWASHGLVVHVLAGLLGQLDSRRQELSARIERREEFAFALRKQRWQRTWTILVAVGGSSLFAVPLYFDDDRVVGNAAAAAMLGFLWAFMFPFIFLLVLMVAERWEMLHPSPSADMSKEYRSVKGRRNKLRRAAEDVARLGREMAKLDEARERLPGGRTR
ncbi:serine/threonine-protein kinase [Nocardiopsis aegyptia]|uniref:serine/threonine-protein kinase n=1 Tax=Nocardiopsis aegyptia TaxID=220378 RepID=UPI00366BABC1